MLDLDALSRAEGKNWIWKGADCLKPAQTICLVSLSNGGGDAVEVREYDTVARRFVDGGFRLAEGKQDVEWIDASSLLVGREWTPGEVTDSGYAYVLKIATRGGEPREVFRGRKTDVTVAPAVLHGAGGKADALMARRGVTFFESEYSLLTDKGPVRIPLPPKADYQTYVGGKLVFALKQPWRSFKAGALVAYRLADLQQPQRADAPWAAPELIFQPGPRQAIQDVASTRSKLAVLLLEDVKGAVDIYDLGAGAPKATRLPCRRTPTSPWWMRPTTATNCSPTSRASSTRPPSGSPTRAPARWPG